MKIVRIDMEPSTEYTIDLRKINSTSPNSLFEILMATKVIERDLQTLIDRKAYSPRAYDLLLQAHRKCQEIGFYTREFLEYHT